MPKRLLLPIDAFGFIGLGSIPGVVSCPGMGRSALTGMWTQSSTCSPTKRKERAEGRQLGVWNVDVAFRTEVQERQGQIELPEQIELYRNIQANSNRTD